MSMRARFVETVADLLDRDGRTVVVLADISVALLEATGAPARHRDRVINVGIREQAMIGVAAGLALEGFRPFVHTYAPFLVERPFEQVKLDLGHQDVGAVLVSVGASYDGAANGRTHQAPEDVALISTLPGWTAVVPGHPDEAEEALRSAAVTDERVYVRLSETTNAVAHREGLVRQGSAGAPAVVAVGPTLDRTLAAVADLDVSVLYATTVCPYDGRALRALGATDVVVVEPLLEGTLAPQVHAGLADVAHRLWSIGVPLDEHRRYGSAADHDAAHGLDEAGIRRRITGLLSTAA